MHVQGRVMAAVGCSFVLVSSAAAAPPKQPTASAPVMPGSSYAMPNNFYGAHLLVDDGRPGSRGFHHLRWARYLVGKWGYAKTLFADIDAKTQGPREGWVGYVQSCYDLELIPLVRLGGRMKDGQWLPPIPDEPGNYKGMAAAVRRVVEKLPRSRMCPLYIELWNEPNLSVEWAGKPNHKEYADFFAQAAAAIRDIGDERIRILNGGLATSPEWTRKLCEDNPDFLRAFDLWACHPYPHNHPPSINFHDKTMPGGSDLAIDSYLLETAVLAELGRPGVKVMLTETGYDLGNSVYAAYPVINEDNRADYIVRAFRDYWSKWPEVQAVFPFEFCNEGWTRFDWVYPDSETNDDGSPSRPHKQYTMVAALAKPTDRTGALSGTITIAGLGSRLEKARVSVHLKNTAAEADIMGNYTLPRLAPGEYRVNVSKPGFAELSKKITIRNGANTVLDASLEASQRAALSGTVISGDTGKPMGGVVVKLSPGDQQATADRRGEYTITECIPGRYRITAQAKGTLTYEGSDVEVAVKGKNRHDFVLGQLKARGPANVLANAGFEAGGGGGAITGIGLGFEPTEPGPREFGESRAEISRSEAHTGRCSQQLVVRSEPVTVRQITHYGTAKPGTRYEAGGWVRADIPGREGQAWVSLEFTRNDGGVIQRFEPKAKASGRSKGWVWLSVEALAPAGSERISVNLHTKGSGGLAYFDDLWLSTAK